MPPPLSIRHLTDAERTGHETARRRHAACTVRRGQIVFARAAGRQPSQIATTWHGAPHTVRHVRHACDARGLAGVPHGSTGPRRVANAPGPLARPRVGGRVNDGLQSVTRRA